MLASALLPSHPFPMRASIAKTPESQTILLVDDNSHGLIARKSVLEELGYQVTTARNGEEALEFYADKHFDLVVTDFKMPKMDGAELIRRVRELDPAARIIMLSGFVEPLGLTEKSTGADVVIAKSAGEVASLIRCVTRLLKVPKKPAASQKALPSRTRASKA